MRVKVKDLKKIRLNILCLFSYNIEYLVRFYNHLIFGGLSPDPAETGMI